ncbi:MAG: chemotaxis protein CheX [Bacillota bacterium]
MKAEFVNPFVAAAFHVLQNITGADADRKQLRLVLSPINAREVNAVIGITGDLQGQVLLGMSKDTAMKFASKMLMGQKIVEFDEVAKSTVNELANMITGNAAAGLGASGFSCRITPPTLFVGKDLLVSAQDTQFLVIPINTAFGEIDFCVVLKNNKLQEEDLREG